MLEILGRRDGREVEGGGLENRCPVMSGTGGSNPSPSAMGSEQLSAISRGIGAPSKRKKQILADS